MRRKASEESKRKHTQKANEVGQTFAARIL